MIYGRIVPNQNSVLGSCLIYHGEKKSFVKDMVLRIRVEEGCWSWRRNLFVWKVELVDECKFYYLAFLCRIMWNILGLRS